MNKRLRRLLASLLLSTALVASLAACGGDDEEESSGTTAGDTTETTAADDASEDEGDGDAGSDGEGEEASGEDLETYCDKTLEIETLPEPEIDFETASPEEQAEGIKAYATEELQPLAQEIQAVTPEEIKAEIDILVGAVDELTETGDFEATFGSPEVEEASDAAHAFDLENCGWEQVDVTAVDYAFEGIDDTLPAGAVSFEFANSSDAESHELVLFRKNDDTTESMEDLLALPQEEAEKKVTPMGGTFAPPGESDSLVTELEAGDYAAVCFIPIGATEENQEGTGPPHFTQGMVTEFTVE